MAKRSYSDGVEDGKDEIRLRVKELIREYSHIAGSLMLGKEWYTKAYEEVVRDLKGILEK